jgi:ABC-type dipeptide/oligopeptide/nickel transport system permease component
MIEQRSAPYTQTAVAKGVPESRIIWKHNLKNAVIPVIAVVSIQIGGMVVGAVLVENVFSLAGLGTLLVDSIKSSDYNIVQAITMLLVFMFLLISMLVDFIYALIDPRIRAK